jgi:hypothetical protein
MIAPERLGPDITWPTVTTAMFSVPIVIVAVFALAASASAVPLLQALSESSAAAAKRPVAAVLLITNLMI